MIRAIALGLLVLCAFGADNTTSNCTANDRGDLSDDVQMVQMAMKVDSRKEKVSARMLHAKGQARHAHRRSKQHHSKKANDEEIALQRYYLGRDVPTQIPGEITAADDAFANSSGVSMNAAGDLPIFLAGLEFDIECVIFFLICFAFLAKYFPNMYAFRATGAYLEGNKKIAAQNAPITWEASEWSLYKWLWYSIAPTREQLIEANGLDQAMLMAFCDMGMEISACLAIPFMLLLAPTYAFLGGNAAGDDRLSHLGIGNVDLESWVFWPVAMTTWFVVIFTQWRLFQWMRMFIGYRETYLLSMPAPQRTTILVEGVPDDLCSDAAMKDYFQRMYGSVKSAYVVKKIGTLEAKVKEYKAIDQKLRETEFWIKHNPDKPKPKFHLLHGAQDCDTFYKSELERLTAEIKAEQKTVEVEARKSPEDSDIYATNAFVTFENRKVAEQAVNTQLRIADDELVVTYPPMPSDVIWGDLEQAVAKRNFYTLVGYGCVTGLFFLYMPIVLGISQAANMETLEDKYPAFKSFTDALGDYRDTLASTLASLGLTIMTSFLPTFLILIFSSFFTLKASRWAQLYLQTYYFWFLVLFVMLVTAIGSSLSEFITEIAESPFIIFSLLAETMPMTTHFYLNYIPLQWVTHAMNMLRYMNLSKYLLFKRFMDPEDARAMAEPEDQDYYGMGSRSARFALMLVLGLVFSSICPLMITLTFFNFLVCRVIYGYLMSYAESKKEDLGGDHFALQLIHVHLGLLIYIIMMTGVLLQRAGEMGPGIISACSFVWWAISFYKFRTKLHWQHLCYEDVVDHSGDKNILKREAKGDYFQEALDPKILEKIKADVFA